MLEIIKDNYFISFVTYSIVIGKDMIWNLKDPVGPYSLDRFILEAFMIEGFKFEKRMSQHIRYVFGIFEEWELKK